MKPFTIGAWLGWYGARAVRLPSQAPPIPRLNSTKGAMQHDDAAIAPSRPPAAAKVGFAAF